MVNSISTKTAREADPVYLRTAFPIVVKGQIVVPVDSYVRGVVSQARRSGRVKGRAELGIRIDSLTLPSGKQVQASPHLNAVGTEDLPRQVVTDENVIKQGGSLGADAAKIAGAAGTGLVIGHLVDFGSYQNCGFFVPCREPWKGAAIGGGAGVVGGLALVLSTRGKEVELKPGSTIEVVFDRAVQIEP